ncbi:METHYL-CPG-BINDING DOMAIN PROTEIN [Salix purpurea]|uniref:METHYL-CPG-BINDING DOMAIN PROTEIN n=1 Tax=Salix purpurea TaxID=77065 RepID=A0A9Q1A1P6_SALPP|nr:METHYL-CPG-BINDING DOMAIN PROTEIN [Salix purpurea]
MATTATRTTTQPPQPLPPNFLPYIDMTTLSQSELYKLSLTFSTQPSTTNNTITPTIDRTNFNESAGSRRQTFARPSYHHHRHRLAATPFTKTHTDPPNDPIPNDPDRLENPTIVKFLKNLLSTHPEFQEPDFSVEFDTFNHFNHPITIISNSSVPQQVLDFDTPPGVRKRKRGRKPKVKALSIVQREMGLEIVNRKGVAVDLVGLASLDDPYKDQLKRRTEGMDKEEELLGFFRELGGQWCSRRKKRKIVDASEFGDFLPVGWKLILGLKRKEGRAWVYCRRYLSPAGQQFVSCKEVSAYLQSFVGPYDAQQSKDHTGDSIQQDHGVALVSHAGAIQRLEDQRQFNEHQKQVSILETGNLAEVQIHDLFECHKCRMTFDEKGTYLEHLLSYHQRTTRRYRLGSSVGDGVIVKDGKFECQFCHKVFHERRRYNGHVGIHVRNYVRGIEDSPGVKNYMRGIEDSPAVQLALQKSDPPTPDDLPARISKMDALIEIAQNSIRETSSSGANDEPNVVSDSKLPASVFEHELNSDSPPIEPKKEDSIPGKSLELTLHQQNVDFMVIDEKIEKVEDASDVQDFKTVSSADAQHHNTSESLGRNDDLVSGANVISRFGIK